MINKKAITFNTLINLIIAALCLVVLIYAGWKFTSIAINSSENDKAQGTLDQIVMKINKLDDGESGSYIVLNPENWVIMVREKNISICKYSDIEDLEDANSRFNNCSVLGMVKEVYYYLESSETCDDTSGCIKFKDLPMEIFFVREGENVLIEKKEVLSARRLSKEIMDYKKDENSKTIGELVIEMIESREGDPELFGKPMGPIRYELQNELRESLNSFFKTVNPIQEFGLREEEFVWIFEIREAGTDNEFFRHVDLENPYIEKHDFAEIIIYSDEEYEAVLEFAKGVKKNS